MYRYEQSWAVLFANFMQKHYRDGCNAASLLCVLLKARMILTAMAQGKPVLKPRRSHCLPHPSPPSTPSPPPAGCQSTVLTKQPTGACRLEALLAQLMGPVQSCVHLFPLLHDNLPTWLLM